MNKEQAIMNGMQLVTNLDNPMIFFTLNGERVALDLTNNMLHPVDTDGMVYAWESESEFEVEQDYSNETTRYIFDEFTIHSSNGDFYVTC